MNDGNSFALTSERPLPTPSTNITTWRYLGDRTAADLAYCVRFDVQEAPEPVGSLAGVWSYALPATFVRK